MPTVRVNDINMYYELRGEGEPFALLPGLGSDVSDYARIIEGLSKHYRVVALDNRGAGRTDKPDTPYSIEMMADDAAGLLTAVGISSTHVLGHSMGGRIALALALRHPELVRSLVLVSTSARVSGRRGRVRLLGGFWRRMPVLRSLGDHPQPYYAFVRQFEASGNYDCSARLGEIRAPTLVVHGKRDRLVPLKLAEETHAGIRASKMVVLGGGHLRLFFKPEECVRAITEFLRTP